MTDMETILEIALACFRPEEWDEIKRICTDLHDT